jgi:DNA-binding transcriptional LysR family regulator
MYRPIQPPGHVVEHLFDEEFVLVTSAKAAARRAPSDYVFVNWGPDFQLDHAAAYPELTHPGLHLDLGSVSIEYLLANEASGYFPARIVKHHVARGRLRQPKRARRFVYPVYMVYPEARDEETYELILHGLRASAARLG